MHCKWRLIIIASVILLIVWGASHFIINYKQNEQPKFQLTNIVKISVHYEALCPDSKYFIARQLQPIYDKIPQHLILDMIPYGKAETKEADGILTFKCQHGETECYANKIHSCVVNYVKEPSVQLNIVSCMIRNNEDPDGIAKICASENNIDVTNILDCAKGDEGSILLKRNGERTNSLNPSVKFIPTVEFNNRQDIIPLSSILKNLQKAVCELLETKPKICEN